MGKYIKQFRYYSDNDLNNWPRTKDEFISTNALIGEKFFTKYMPIIQLGIQTLPGTKFYLNDIERLNPIIIGYTGIYELNLEGIAEINTLAFDLESINRISTNKDAYLIIDIVYEKEE